MYGLKLGNVHTASYGLGCLSCDIGPPEPVFKYISIPGADGKLDATEAVYGRVTYNSRQLTATFEKPCSRVQHTQFSMQLDRLYHGKVLNITVDDAPEHYLKGRAVWEHRYEDTFGHHSLKADCDPYRYKTTLTIRSFSVSGSLSISLANAQMPVCPYIYTDSSGMSVQVGGKQYNIITGGMQIPDIVLSEGANSFKLLGTGSVIIEYREGEL